MKKILIFSLCIITLFSFFTFGVEAANCDYNNGSLVSELENCLGWSDLVDSGDGIIESWVKQKIKYWTSTLWNLLGLLAVWAVVYGGLLMTLSGGEDEKIKKWKDVVKWALIGFLWVVMTSAVIRVVIEFVFDVAA